MDPVQLIANAETEKAINLLLKDQPSKDAASKLTILKANLKKVKRQHMLGLVSKEQESIVFAKTNQYLMGYINGADDVLEIDENEIKAEWKGIAKQLLMGGCVVLLLFSFLLLYLRRDILTEMLLHQNFQVDFQLLFFPIILMVISLYLFKKIKSYA